MRRVFGSILILISCFFTASYSVYAVWNDAVAVSGNIVTSGTADLRVSAVDGFFGQWQTTAAVSSFIVSGLIPGSDEDLFNFAFSLDNASTTGINFALKAKISGYSGTDGIGSSDLDKLQLAVFEEGSSPDGGSGWIDLSEWLLNEKTLNSLLLNGSYKNYNLSARLKSGTGDNWQNRTVILQFAVTGEQNLSGGGSGGQN